MALKIRLQRRGIKNAPTYNLVVAESSSPRDGKFIKSLGIYNPQAKGKDFLFKINMTLLEYWLGVGAQPSETAKNLIKKARKKTKTENGEAIELATAVA